VPFFTIDEPRSVTLSYNGDRAMPRPFVFELVEPNFGDSEIAEYWLHVSVNGVTRTFVNGDTMIVYTGGSDQLRLAGQFDARDLATGVYPMTIKVTAKYADGITKERNSTTELMIVNDAASDIAKGWTIAGLQRLYFPSVGGYMITEGDGTAVRFTALGVKALDFTRLTFDGTTYFRTYPDGTVVRFDTAGRMKNVVEISGLTTNYQYDASGRITQIDDPMRVSGAAVPHYVFNYGAAGLSSIVETGGPGPDRTTAIASTAGVGIQSITDPDALTTSFGYDATGRLKTVTNRRGGVSTFIYDDVTWKLQILFAPIIGVDAGGGNTTPTSPGFRYAPWQSTGMPKVPTSSASPAPGQIAANVYAIIADPMNRLTYYSVNRYGQPMFILDPAGLGTTITRSGFLVTDITKPTGDDHFAYDSLGRITMSQPAGREQTVLHRDGPHGEITSVTGGGSRGQVGVYNEFGQLEHIELVNPRNPMTTMEFTYDPVTKRVASVNELSPPGRTLTENSYDSLFGNLRQSIAAGTRISTRTFDRFGRDSTITASGLATSTILYDVMNRPISHYDGVNATPTTLVYDALFQTDIRDANGNQYHTDYNALGWPIQECDALSRCSSFRYDASGLLTSSTNRRNEMMALAYDGAGRVISKTGANTTTDHFSYSSDGRGVVAWNDVETDSISLIPAPAPYATVQRTVRVIDSARTWIKIEHIYEPNIDGAEGVSITTNGDVVYPFRRFDRSVLGVADTITMMSAITAIGRDAAGRRSFDNYLGLTTFNNTFTTLDAVRSTSSNATLDPAFYRSYHYDAAGRIDQAQNPFANKQLAHTYDALGRLTKRDVKADCTVSPDTATIDAFGIGYSCATVLSSEAFSYDAVGNRTDKNAVVITGNRYQQFNGLSYAYDNDGNVIQKYDPSRFNRQYFWSAENRLDSLRQDSWYRVKYEYNALGEPVRKLKGDVNGALSVDRYYIWDGDDLIAELDKDKHRVVEYVNNPGTVDEPFSIMVGPTAPTAIRFERQDELGNVIGEIENGAVGQVVDYTAWGTPTVKNKSDNRLYWKGLMWEGDIVNLYYMRNRWYDPDDGRFLSEDPIGHDGGINLYAFGDDDPINAADPDGLQPDIHCSVIPHASSVTDKFGPHYDGKFYYEFVCRSGGGSTSASPQPARRAHSGGGGRGTGATNIGEKTDRELAIIASCASEYYGMAGVAGALARGSIWGGAWPVFKPSVGLPIIGESSSYTNPISLFGLRNFPGLKLPVRVLQTKRVFGLVGRANVAVAAALLAYDVANIGSCASQRW
jgi:RHS repeat-associated protein